MPKGKMQEKPTPSSIYEPVAADLEDVRRELRKLATSEHKSFPELSQMLDHVTAGGKGVRPALNLLAGKLFHYEPSVLLPMAVATELLHIATLVHDDSIDQASTRHGKLTINEIWGFDNAILLGDYLFSTAGEFAAHTGNLRVIRLFSYTLKTISAGELKQSFNAFNLHQNIDDYMDRIFCKTAALFMMATESGSVLSQASEESIQALNEYSRCLGIAFQIVDDILDFIGDEKVLGKPTGSDLLQGTLTLPSLMLLEKYREDNPIEHLFQGEDQDKYRRLAITMIRESSIIADCYQIASNYAEEAIRSLEGLSAGDAYRSLVELAQYVVQREQ